MAWIWDYLVGGFSIFTDAPYRQGTGIGARRKTIAE